jgi:phage recombination protein Bet
MAGTGKELTDEILGKAIQEFVSKNKGIEASEGEQDGRKRWLLSPGDIIVQCKDGRLECATSGVRMDLAKIIMDMWEGEPGPDLAKTPERPRKSEVKQIVPYGQRNRLDHSLMKTVNQLTVQDVRDHFCTGATEQEAYTFLQTCLMAGANPWLSEAYLIKYDEKSAARTVMGKYYFLKKAEVHPKYGGFSSGIIVETPDGKIVEKVGKFKLQDEKLLGAWAEVVRTDRKVPLKVTVPFSEYDKGNSQWRKMPATMIEKVAIVQAHRDAFPTDLGGLYDAAEVIDVECEVVG